MMRRKVQMQLRRLMLTATVFVVGSASVHPNARAADPIQFFDYNIIGPVEEHVFSIGNDPDHVLVFVRAVGANLSTGNTSFLDGARVIGTTWSDMTKGSGVAHGYIAMQDRVGTWLMSIDEKNHMVTADGKP